MKKLVFFLLTAMLLISFSSTAFAKPVKHQEYNKKNTVHTAKEQTSRKKTEKKNYGFSGSSVIKYGRYQLPIKAVSQGMGATVTFDKANAVLTVVKGTITIKIDFINKSVFVNDVEDTASGIFKAKNTKKTTVLIKYIADKLGVRTSVDKDKVTVEIPRLDAPKNIIITPVGATVVSNTLNSTTKYLTVSAEITPGQAAGGKAELYIGNRLVATNTAITATGSAIQFTTSDGAPSNEKLQALIPEGGAVTIKLYNANNESVVSKANIKLKVDYVAPSILGVSAAVLNKEEGKLTLVVSGSSIVADSVDVTKLTIYDSSTTRTYQLTNAPDTGSKGFVKSVASLEIKLGSTDLLALQSFGTSTVTLTIAPGSLLIDAAGNVSIPFTVPITVPVTIIE